MATQPISAIEHALEKSSPKPMCAALAVGTCIIVTTGSSEQVDAAPACTWNALVHRFQSFHHASLRKP